MRHNGAKMSQLLLHERSIAAFCIISVIYLHATKAECLSNCRGKLLSLSTYASCDSCNKYVKCNLLGGLTTYDCLLGMVYDDTLKLCRPFSGSCADYANLSATTAAVRATTTTDPTTTVTDSTTTNPTTTVTNSITTDPTTTVTDSTTTIKDPTTTPKQPVVSTKPTGPTNTVLPPLKPAIPGQMLPRSMYIKVMLQTFPCNVNASSFKSLVARSNVECAARCNTDRQCWYFKFINRTCLLYSLSLPPCDVYIYKYIG